MRTPRGYVWAKEHPIPSFASLHIQRAPDHVNVPRTSQARYPLHGGLPGLTADVEESLPDRRTAFTISEAALTRLMAPPAGSDRSSSSAALLQELTDIARSRLGMADIMELRDRLTTVLEEQSGKVASAATALHVSRQYEAALRAGKPVSVRGVTHAFPRWPPQVQSSFFKSVLQLGKLPYDDDCVVPAAPTVPDGSRLPDYGSAAFHAGGGGAAGHAPAQFVGLQGNTALQPLGLALPALRTPRNAAQAAAIVGRADGATSRGGGGGGGGGRGSQSARTPHPPPSSPARRSSPPPPPPPPPPMGASLVKPSSRRSPRLAALGSKIEPAEPSGNVTVLCTAPANVTSTPSGAHAMDHVGGARPNSPTVIAPT